jgi:DNA-binding NarL/FixJ family response regulator
LPALATAGVPRPLEGALYVRAVTSVLLVDDDAAYRRSLQSFLEASYDLRVVADTGDGNEALRLARELRPDAVVVDLAMPGVGGLDTAAAIARELPETVIVVVTGADDTDERNRAPEVGVGAWLPKGDPLQVENALRSLVKRAHP